MRHRRWLVPLLILILSGWGSWSWWQAFWSPPVEPFSRMAVLFRMRAAARARNLSQTLAEEENLRRTARFEEPESQVYPLTFQLRDHQTSDRWRKLETVCREEAQAGVQGYRKALDNQAGRKLRSEWLLLVMAASGLLAGAGSWATRQRTERLVRELERRKQEWGKKQAAVAELATRLVARTAEQQLVGAKLTRKRKEIVYEPKETGSLTLEAGRLRLYGVITQDIGRRDLWCLALDIDNLSRLNAAAASNTVADATLSEWVGRILGQLRPEVDFIFRPMGRKFLVCLPGVAQAQAQDTVGRIMQALTTPLETLAAHHQTLRIEYSGALLRLSALPGFDRLRESYTGRDLLNFDEAFFIGQVQDFIKDELDREAEKLIALAKAAGGDHIRDQHGHIFQFAHKTTKGTP